MTFDKEVCCQCIWWSRGKKSLFKKKAKRSYLLVLQFVSVDCAQHVANIKNSFIFRGAIKKSLLWRQTILVREKKSCSLSSFIFIVYFFFLNKLTAWRGDCDIMAISGNPVMPACALDGLCQACLPLYKTSGCNRGATNCSQWGKISTCSDLHFQLLCWSGRKWDATTAVSRSAACALQWEPGMVLAPALISPCLCGLSFWGSVAQSWGDILTANLMP